MAWFRRGKKKQDDAQGDDALSSPDTPEGEAPDETGEASSGTQTQPGSEAPTRTGGPYDRADAPFEEGYVKLGSMWLPAVKGLMLTFEMDQTQSRVTAVQVVLGDSTLQLQAFAAPRSRGIWEEIRGEIRESIEGQGGTVEELEGPQGTELQVELNGGRMLFLGVDGPRWFLRGVMTGRAAADPQIGNGLREVFSHVVVDRGGDPMGPRELLPLELPDQDAPAAPVEPTDEKKASDLDPFTRGPEITEVR
ncbi:MAG: DUF3710 domain-containing protein [Mobilicoccus sp.]|nr:DUF3710 domain-containing protein [Mobilicoccus sp.]